jgi:general secretion pathway protein F
MPLFRYKVVDTDGAVVRGQIEAATRGAAASRLQARGHLPLAVEVATSSHRLRDLLALELHSKQRRSPTLVAELIRRLSLLLDAGVALEGCLALIASSEGWADIRLRASSLLRRLRQGANLADAMAAEEGVFSPVVVAVVRAGEASGALAPRLAQLADYLSRAQAVRQSVRSALIYPAVLLFTAAGTILLVLLVILPQLAPVFADTGSQLPLTTRVAFAASTLTREWWWLMAVTALIFGLIARRLLREPGMRARRDAFVLRLPVLGLALRRAETARFTRVLGALIGGGVPLPTALSLAQPVLSNRVFAEAAASIATAVREGEGIAAPLSRAAIFPDLAVQMVRIGEATGRLDEMLSRLSGLLEADVQRTLTRALAMLVPGLTIVLGAVVAGIIASVMLAVLGVNDLVR